MTVVTHRETQAGPASDSLPSQNTPTAELTRDPDSALEVSEPVRARLVPWRIRLTLVAAGAPLFLFTVACLVYNAPPSAAQNRLKDSVAHVLEPYFWQDWQLFAPSPGASVPEVLLQTRLRRSDGHVVETTPVEVEDAVDRTPRRFRLNPTKLPGIFLSLNGTASRYEQAEGQIAKLPKAQRAQAQRALDLAFTNNFTELQRFMSVRAQALYPREQVLAVRVTFGDRAIVPFSQRYVSPPPPQKFQEALQTSWMAYVPGVAR